MAGLKEMLTDAEQLLQLAGNLAKAQEVEVSRMVQRGADPTRAELLLGAYRAGVVIAAKRVGEILRDMAGLTYRRTTSAD